MSSGAGTLVPNIRRSFADWGGVEMESGNWLKSRGITFLVGLVTLWLLFRWWISGAFFHVAAFATGEPSPGFSSVGMIFWSIAIDLICALGFIAITLGTDIWAFVWDFVTAFRDKMAGKQSVVTQLPKALAAIQSLHARLKVLEAQAIAETPPVATVAATVSTPKPKPKPAAKKTAAKPKAKAPAKEVSDA